MITGDEEETVGLEEVGVSGERKGTLLQHQPIFFFFKNLRLNREESTSLVRMHL